jgi:adenylate cyclase
MVAELPTTPGGPVAGPPSSVGRALLATALLVPLAGLVVLLVVPEADVRWEHQPSHFWLVLGTAIVAAVLGWTVGTAARRRNDARLFLVSLAFVAAAAFLGLHALATPRVLLDGANSGFVLATPVGLLLASGFAAWSARPLDGDGARRVMAAATTLRVGLTAVVVVWAIWSLSSWPPLDEPSPPEAGSPVLVGLAIPAVALFAFAALRYGLLAARRRSTLALAVGAAWILLAESMIAATVARNWRASWWEWHVLMVVAFGVIAWAAHRLPDNERFGDLYLDEVAGGTREVSILFADLEGFTAYAESVAPEQVHTMLNTYLGAVMPAISRHGGRLDRFMGDAVMVTFNVGVDQPDHATRAARAALAFQAAASAVAAAHPGWPRFRSGVNTGEAVVGMVGTTGERDYTVLGDTVNVAARLEALAAPGEVAIGGETLRALTGARVSALGAVNVKGRTAPVEAWRLDDISTDTAPAADGGGRG